MAELIFPPLQDAAPLGANSARIERLARRIAQRVRNDESGITAYVNGNESWLGFKFSADRLIEVRERHNNPSRSPPFVGKFLRSLVSLFGEPATVREDYRGACNAVWESDAGRLTAVWRDSEWFIDMYYAPNQAPPEVLSDARQRELWRYYIAQEDALGREAALAETARRFGISTNDVHRIVVRGLEEQWPLE